MQPLRHTDKGRGNRNALAAFYCAQTATQGHQTAPPRQINKPRLWSRWRGERAGSFIVMLIPGGSGGEPILPGRRSRNPVKDDLFRHAWMLMRRVNTRALRRLSETPERRRRTQTMSLRRRGYPLLAENTASERPIKAHEITVQTTTPPPPPQPLSAALTELLTRGFKILK